MPALMLEVITPEKIVLKTEAASVTAPGIQGYLGVLPRHAPLITPLKAGVVTYSREGSEAERLAVSGGFLEAGADRVVILADTAEKATDIDVERARQAKERAEKRLRERPANLDVARAEAALQRALARLKAAGVC
ncbi:MAG: F0F1 ATP synthase subunit epsilon [Clostridia bacterium]|nr:F0F1 ATP synthase subunit epsilon [Clostridia bacterium]